MFFKREYDLRLAGFATGFGVEAPSKLLIRKQEICMQRGYYSYQV